MSSPNRSRPRDGLSSDDFDSESSILVRVVVIFIKTDSGVGGDPQSSIQHRRIVVWSTLKIDIYQPQQVSKRPAQRRSRSAPRSQKFYLYSYRSGD